MLKALTRLAGATLGTASGRFDAGHAFDRLGRGPRPLVVLQGLTVSLQPLGPAMARVFLSMYGPPDGSTVTLVNRRPGMPRGASIADYAADAAALLRSEFGTPVDVVGTSTGGSIALRLAIDHPDVVDRLVIHSSAHRLGPEGQRIQREAADHARRGDWDRAARALVALVRPRRRTPKAAFQLAEPLVARLLRQGAPEDPRDFVTLLEAEDVFDCADQLSAIEAPTLVVAGDADPAYAPALFERTADGIPGGRLVLLEGMGHPAQGPRFRAEIAAFLKR